MRNLEGKRLLISGGPALACDIVEKAKEMGVYTVVTDWYADSPAKRIADESHMVSTADIDAMVVLAKNRNVNGVITSFIDSNLHNVRQICERLDLPFYATKDQLDLTMNKASFKELCRKHGVPVVDEFPLEHDLKQEHLDGISYPVLLKPADNSGSRGIVVCENEEELLSGYDQALSFSQCGTVIVEKFMDTSAPGVNIDYVVCDGRIHLSAVGDLFLYHGSREKAPLSEAVFYPSVRLEEYVNTVDNAVRMMFGSIGLRNGVLYIQSFYDEEGFHFYEMGYRLGGGQSYRMISRINGTNHLEMLIHHSLTGTMCDYETEQNISPYFDAVACGLFVLMRPGRIETIRGLDDIRRIPEVVNIMQSYHEGDCLSDCAEGTTQQVFARLHFVAKHKADLLGAIQRAQSLLKVEDDNGKSMILGDFVSDMANGVDS